MRLGGVLFGVSNASEFNLIVAQLAPEPTARAAARAVEAVSTRDPASIV